MIRNRTWLSLGLLSIAAVWAFTGCSTTTDTDAPNDVSTRTQSVNLDDPYGGYNTADEQPAFGDSYLLDNYGAETNNFVAASDSDSTREDHMRIHRYLMVTWGNLRADSTIDFSTDWSGSLCVENAIVRPVRTIRFEYPQDYLTPPASRNCVAWVSHTRPHFDGILFSLHHMPCDSLSTLATPDSLCGSPMSVTFTTGPLTVTFTQDELRNLHKVIKVDDAGNAVAFNTLTLEPHACPHGFLAGQWKNVEGKRYDGIFRGEWMTENGLHAGFLRGVYGQNRHGENVFFAKWINDGGHFRGIMAGTYGRNPESTTVDADGWFKGMWFSRNLQVAGNVGGVWGDHSGDDEEGGFFRGVWDTNCR